MYNVKTYKTQYFHYFDVFIKINENMYKKLKNIQNIIDLI